MRRSTGFTMVELMMVVAVLGILTVVAVVGYTRVSRKARSAEVPVMFSELKTREEAYRAENGKYLPVCRSALGVAADSDCGENDYWPNPLVGKGSATNAGAPPIRWQTLHAQISTAGLYCQYEVVAGLANTAGAIGPTGLTLFAGAAPPRNWYYVLGQCDWDGDPARNALYWQRDDLTVMGLSNELN